MITDRLVEEPTNEKTIAEESAFDLYRDYVFAASRHVFPSGGEKK